MTDVEKRYLSAIRNMSKEQIADVAAGRNCAQGVMAHARACYLAMQKEKS